MKGELFAMFDKLTQKMAKKMGQSVKTTLEPIRTEVKETVDNKVNLYSRILRLGVLILLFIDGTKRVNQIVNEPNHGPSQIVINNYLSRKDGED